MCWFLQLSSEAIGLKHFFLFIILFIYIYLYIHIYIFVYIRNETVHKTSRHLERELTVSVSILLWAPMLVTQQNLIQVSASTG
jgi:hypothetical protein